MFKATRKKHKLTQKQMAKLLKAGHDSINKYERSERMPSFEKLYLFQKEFSFEELTEELREEFERMDKNHLSAEI